MATYETIPDLRKAAERKAGPLDDTTWEFIAPECEWPPPYDDADLDNVLAGLQQDKSVTKEPGPNRRAKSHQAIWQHAHAESDLRATAAAELVARIREDIFGSQGAPFPDDMPSAREWINRQAELEGPATVHEVGQATLPDDTVRAAKPWCNLLDWPGEDGWVRRCSVIDGGKLDKLRIASEDLAKRLHCQKAQATAHLLSGQVPLVAPTRYTVHQRWEQSGVDNGMIGVTVEVNYPWVPASFVAYTYREALKSASERSNRLTRRARPAPLAMRARAFLAEHEGEDGWTLLKKWNQAYPDDTHASQQPLLSCSAGWLVKHKHA